MTARFAPASVEDLAAIIRDATAPMRIAGGGTRRIGSTAAQTLTTAALTGVSLYEPGALTMVVAAGTPLAEVEAELAAEGQRLAFEPPDLRGLLGTTGTPTIGGVVATNASGPRRVRLGACRDSLIGIAFVDGSGALVRNGGRVMKNVTGYDLVKLVAGSRGILGVVTECALRVLPAPLAQATLILADAGPRAAVAAMSAALGSPYEVTGAAWVPGTGVLICIEGFGASVEYRAARLAALLARHEVVVTEADPEPVAALWRRVRDVAPFQDRPGDVWRFSLRPSAAPDVVARLGPDCFLDWGGGLVWTLQPPGTDARRLAAPYQGHATLVRCAAGTAGQLPVLEPDPPAIAALTASLRASFDPRGVFDTGLAG